MALFAEGRSQKRPARFWVSTQPRSSADPREGAHIAMAAIYAPTLCRATLPDRAHDELRHARGSPADQAKIPVGAGERVHLPGRCLGPVSLLPSPRWQRTPSVGEHRSSPDIHQHLLTVLAGLGRNRRAGGVFTGLRRHIRPDISNRDGILVANGRIVIHPAGRVLGAAIRIAAPASGL